MFKIFIKDLAVILLPVFLTLMYMHIRISFTTDMPLIGDYRCLRALISLMFDTFTLGLIANVLCLGKRKYMYVLMACVSMLWCYVNIVYATYFHVYLSLTVVSEVSNLTDLPVLTYIANAMRGYDILPLMFFSAVPLCNKYLKTNFFKTNNKDWRYLVVLILLMMGYFTALKLFVYEGHLTFPNSKTIKQISLMPPIEHVQLTPNTVVYQFGVVRTQILTALFRSADKTLTPSEIEEIDRFLYKINSKRCSDKSEVESVSKKNLVFIMAESYLALTANMRVGGKEVTPFLNSLRRSQEAVFNDSVMQNIGIGESSDGQFIYMTGLIPLADNLTISAIGNNHLYALPNMLKGVGYETMMTNPCTAELWNQETMCSLYGIDKHYALAKSGNDWKNDIEMISSAIQNEKKASEPFFHLMLTSTTHGPYNDDTSKLCICRCFPAVKPENISNEFFNYLQKCHFMDHAISQYISSLKKRGLMDRSIVVIASDHGWSEEPALLPKKEDARRLSLLIIGADSETDYVKSAINQIDIFTTVTDIMHLGKVDASWQGLGYSIFQPLCFENSVSDKSKYISANIIYGDYNYYKRN